MKKILFIIALFPILALGQAPTPTENYIHTTIFKDSLHGTIPTQQITYFDGLGRPKEQIAHKQSPAGHDMVIRIEYDAFGRQAKEFLPVSSEQNLEYHAIAPSDVLSFYSGSVPAIATTLKPYSEKELEASPLSRVMKQSAPGEAWAMGSGHEVKFDYQTNIASDAVRFFKVTTAPPGGNYEAYSTSLVENGFYPNSRLYKTITTNENWTSNQDDNLLNTTEEFKDKEGRIILKRTYINHETHPKAEKCDTYYVYDNYGNLSFVIPPLAAAYDAGPVTNVLESLCYQYRYDYRNRLVEKRLPGKQWEFIAYNSQDMPVATGPAKNPWGTEEWGWLITKYDTFGRVAYTGWMQYNVDSSTRIGMTGELAVNWAEQFIGDANSVDGIAINYTNNTNPTNIKLLTVNYYDGYTHNLVSEDMPDDIEGQDVKRNCKGLATCSWVRVLTAPDAAAANITHMYYDYKGRVIGTQKYNYLEGYTKVENKLDFMGKLLKSTTTHKRSPADTDSMVKVVDTYVYSDQDRLLMHKQKINDLDEQLIALNEYNELGQLISKEVGGTDFSSYKGFQKVDYKYNIRGWLTDINDIDRLQEGTDPESIPKDLFAFHINYNDAIANASDEVQPLFNGNIAETSWRTSSDNILRRYGYRYDYLNRLLKAIYQKPNATIPVTHMYDEEQDYDLNGNIQWLKRNGDIDAPEATSTLQIDKLFYTYYDNNPNRLKEVTDNSSHGKGFLDEDDDTNDTDYTYDDNGNLISDLNKNISSITYNHLNLPVQISFAGVGTINYLYDGAGQKIGKTVTDGTNTNTTDYLDGFQYTNGYLNFFPHAEGYVNVTRCNSCEDTYKNVYDYVFNYTDHLGNVRVSWALDKLPNVLRILEQNHYYPFGLKHTHYNADTKVIDLVDPNGGNPLTSIFEVTSATKLANKYKYNGKELQDELGLNMYDYGAMLYDPALGRRNNIDPKAEQSRRWSPYSYCYNNPIYFVDPDGMQGQDWFVNNITGDVVFLKGKSAVSQGDLNSINLKNFSPNDFERLGSDNMFGNNVNVGGIKNITNLNHAVIKNPENFMKEQGLEKGKRITTETVSTIDRSPEGDIGANIITTRIQSEKVLDTDITYATSNKFDKEQTISSKTEVLATAAFAPVLKRNTTTSVTIIPYNQNPEQKKGSTDAWKAFLQGSAELLKSLAKSKK